ncbi:hypothetical protein [Microcoleus sp. herbarium14]|uniref:hypothetical protein n=1 Tax=Microcoleus sp. herbarium14 TaxID=3055439 RepID=UPI002FCE9AE5
MLTAALTLKLLRSILVDYNYWPSDGDSPLSISRHKRKLTEETILSRDAAARRASEKDSNNSVLYKPPKRRIEVKTLDETFKPLVIDALAVVQSIAQEIEDGLGELELLQLPIEKSEFFIQLYSAFNQSTNPKVYYVFDVDGVVPNPYIGLYITGESSDGVVIAQTLIQNDT